MATIHAGADICQQLEGLSAGQRRLERKIVRHVRREAMATAAADASPEDDQAASGSGSFKVDWVGYAELLQHYRPVCDDTDSWLPVRKVR